MTDNSSSPAPSKGPTRGEEMTRLTPEELKRATDLLDFAIDSDHTRATIRRVAAALSAQEARHQQEMEAAIGAAFGLSHSKHCPLTHEPTGAKIECLSCQRSKAEQELAEAKRASGLCDKHGPNAGRVLRGCWGCSREEETTALAEAESKLREATARLSFNDLRETSALRCAESFPQCAEWTAADWGNALAGEVGEACNKIKKLRRGEVVPHEDIADELADVVIYADLAAWFLGQSLEAAIVRKFNEVSARVGSDLTLAALRSGPARRQ